MIAKTKKISDGKILRLETGGEIKEIIIKEDFMNLKNLSVNLCFRGKTSSGIISLNSQEIELIYKKLAPKINQLKKFKVMKLSE